MSSGYLVERQLEDLIVIPIALPVTRIEASSELTLSVLQLTSSSQRLKHPYLQIKVVTRDPSTPVAPSRDDVSHGYVFGAIYDKNSLLVAGSSTEISAAGNLAPPMTATLPATITPISGPSIGSDEYTYRVVNNCTSVAVEVIVAGVWKIDLNAV